MAPPLPARPIALTVGSPTITAPVLYQFRYVPVDFFQGQVTMPTDRQPTDPEVWPLNSLKWDEDGPIKEALFSNYNADMRIECDPASLVGRTDPGRGVAQKITVALPLVLAAQQLQFAGGNILERLDTIEKRLTMGLLYNLARVTTATTGTGTITLGAAVPGFLTFAQAGVTDGQVVSYGIADGTNSEVGEGMYTASGTTLTRTVTNSTNSNTAINLSGTAQVFITPRASDIAIVGPIVYNKKTVDSNYTIPSDSYGHSVGPVTITGGYTVTVPSDSRWVIL